MNTNEHKEPFYTKAQNFFEMYRKQILIAIVAIIAIGAGGYFYKTIIFDKKQEAAYDLLGPVERWFVADSFGLVIKGQGKIKGAPYIADNYSGKPGNLAKYYSGVSYLKTGDFKKSIKYLEKVDFDDKYASIMATGLLGDAYYESGNTDDALDQYVKAAKADKNSFTTVYWYKKAAAIHEKRNEWDKALDIYENIYKNFKESEAMGETEKLLARAKAKTGKY